MQPATSSNRIMIGIIAFSVSFGLSLVLNWNFNQALFTGAIAVPATYLAALFVDKRRRNSEMLLLDSLSRRIRELEGLKNRVVEEVNRLEAHRSLLYKESTQLQNQITDRRCQRDSLNRELSSFIGEKKQLEVKVNYLQTEIHNLEKNKVELNNTFTSLAAEKRRLDLNYNLSRSEITQVQKQIGELEQQKQELENSVTLLNRLKPQLEEKLHELREQIQKLETQVNKQNKLLSSQRQEKENIENKLKSLQTQIGEEQTQLENLQGQVGVLQAERDQLQSQVWELLQQVNTLEQEPLYNDSDVSNNVDLFPFADLIESLEPVATIGGKTELPLEWTNLIKHLREHEIQVLKAIIEQENPYATIKKIAEENITMPNILIDAINEHANDTIGELIINPSSEPIVIYQEHMTMVKRAIAMHQNIMARQTS
ncbi:hypothetical protein ICL16_22455 [Iningainema sp. BLCCT55]|uniref:TerB-C domain-containing protein n=3 Tax=Iningainema TaxID=1932705 RepID=A0A8J6XMV1_9CYAN|nr:hypothetical protein [Iningainema tapete BLCC-T55]